MPTSVLRRAPGSPALLAAVVRRIGDAMLTELGLEHAELSVLLTNDREIHALNLRHRAKDRATDVLAFPIDDAIADNPFAERPTPSSSDGFGVKLLGDVVISLDTAQRQARGRKRELLPEVRFLLAHGLLHLLGYDHGEPEEKRVMAAMTRRLVRAVAGMASNPRKNSATRSKHPRGGSPLKQPNAGKHPARPRARHAK